MSLSDDLTTATKKVTGDWKKAKQKADKDDRVSKKSMTRMRYYAPPRTSVREVAFEVMEAAYNKASSNGQYYANARQIMYAARPAILAQADTKELNDVYFTQTLLKDYLEEYQPNWKVVWDARGNLIEPHTRERVPLGGIGVASYSKSWLTSSTFNMPGILHEISTKGPKNRYGNVLFIEKEGFTEILSAAQIPERYDMALMSTKGIPNDASCDLIRDMQTKGVRVFVLHDFDLAGFKIVKTLRTGTRLTTGSEVTDLGLRLSDVDGLPDEEVSYSQSKDPSHYLRECGATEDEIAILVKGHSYRQWYGRRVEINAMTSEELIHWLEAKFKEHNVEKVLPDTETLKEAYRSALRVISVEARIEEIENEIEYGGTVPEDLRETIIAKMKNGSGSASWDSIVWDLASHE